MDTLQQFYENAAMREDVKSFLIETLKQFALEELFNGGEAKDVAKALKVVENAFIKLTELYEPLKKASTANQAR